MSIDMAGANLFATAATSEYCNITIVMVLEAPLSCLFSVFFNLSCVVVFRCKRKEKKRKEYKGKEKKRKEREIKERKRKGKKERKGEEKRKEKERKTTKENKTKKKQQQQHTHKKKKTRNVNESLKEPLIHKMTRKIKNERL